jgi:16S rRNA U516 pseudouridylate synthase RsuA-like enzyme
MTGKRVMLHRALSKLGWGSRAQAREWIRSGQVRVDGRVVTDPLAWVDLGRQRITRLAEEPGTRERLALALIDERSA